MAVTAVVALILGAGLEGAQLSHRAATYRRFAAGYAELRQRSLARAAIYDRMGELVDAAYFRYCAGIAGDRRARWAQAARRPWAPVPADLPEWTEYGVDHDYPVRPSSWTPPVLPNPGRKDQGWETGTGLLRRRP